MTDFRPINWLKKLKMWLIFLYGGLNVHITCRMGL